MQKSVHAREEGPHRTFVQCVSLMQNPGQGPTALDAEQVHRVTIHVSSVDWTTTRRTTSTALPTHRPVRTHRSADRGATSTKSSGDESRRCESSNEGDGRRDVRSLDWPVRAALGKETGSHQHLRRVVTRRECRGGRTTGKGGRRQSLEMKNASYQAAEEDSKKYETINNE